MQEPSRGLNFLHAVVICLLRPADTTALTPSPSTHPSHGRYYCLDGAAQRHGLDAVAASARQPTYLITAGGVDSLIIAIEDQSPDNRKSKNAKKVVQISLTGPYRSISADGCVAIELDLHHGCQYRASSYVAEILIDIYDDSIEYDLPITKEVKTCICPHSPRAEVKYAILSNAVEAVVEVKLCQRYDPTDSCYVKGKIVALSDLGEVVLFKSNEENKLIGPSHGLTTIPLTRSVLAMRLEFHLTIKVDLHICSTGETVKESLICKPDLDNKYHPVGQNDVVQVKLTCSD